MPVIRPIRELQNTTEISHFAKTLNEPIFITKNGRNDLVLMNDAVYERIMAQNEMYRKLAAAEAEVADGAELLDGMEVLKELSTLSPRPRILVLSGFARGNVADTAAQLGADYCMMKPCKTSSVLE